MFSTPSFRARINNENSENVAARKNIQEFVRKPLLDLTLKAEQGTPLKLQEKTACNGNKIEKDDLKINFSLFKDVPDTFNDLNPMKESDFIKIRDCFVGFRPETPPPEDMDFKFEPEPYFVSLPPSPECSLDANNFSFEDIDEIPEISLDLQVF